LPTRGELAVRAPNPAPHPVGIVKGMDWIV
jgi:hypothetical protein